MIYNMSHFPGWFAYRNMKVEIGRHNIVILFWKEQGCAVLLLGTHKSEPDIYIGFSPALFFLRA
jgi:hypothetical protein